MNKAENILYIVGRLDCPRTTHCRFIIDDMLKKIKNLHKVEFVLSFETQYDRLKEELVKENLKFMDIECPMIYIENLNKEKEIIGTLEDFIKYAITNYFYYDTKETSSFVSATNQILSKIIHTNGNKYCYFDISIDHLGIESQSIQGRVVFELFATECPKTCENFLNLCKGLDSGSNKKISYAGTIIHRIVKNGYIQGGDLSRHQGDAMSLIPELPDESYNIPHVHAGIVGMVKKGNRKHSGQCQFYITLTEMKSFDQLYVAFGRIIQGFGIIKEIENVDVYLQKPTRRITVEGCGEYII